MAKNRLPILVISLVASAVIGVALAVLAAMSDGMTHSSRAMYKLFPYGTSLVMRTSWQYTELFLLLFEFPVYALILNLVRPLRWKVVALVLIIAFHVGAVVLGMRAYGSPISQGDETSMAG
jgi:hypothetical protein